jgi:hypothetical protein
MFHYARRSLAIVVDGWAPGHVYLEGGRVIHATYRELSGEDAVRSILAMPAGSLRTMVLPDGIPHTIGRDLESLLLDSLRAVDEATAADSDTWNLGDFDEPQAPPRPRMQIFVDRLRRVDGYVSACLVDSTSGVILGADGELEGVDLQGVVAGYCELYRAKCAAAKAIAPDDRIYDIVITLPRQYHVLHAVSAQRECFVYTVYEKPGSIAMITRALAAAEAALDV